MFMFLVWIETGDGRMGLIAGTETAADTMRGALSQAYGRDAVVVGPKKHTELLHTAHEEKIVLDTNRCDGGEWHNGQDRKS